METIVVPNQQPNRPAVLPFFVSPTPPKEKMMMMIIITRRAIMQCLPLMSTIFRLNHHIAVVHGLLFCHKNHDQGILTTTVIMRKHIGYWQNSNSKVGFLDNGFISTTCTAGSSSSLTRRLFSSRSGGSDGDSNNRSNGRGRRRRPNNRRPSPPLPPPPIPLPGQAGRGNFRELINVGVNVLVIKKNINVAEAKHKVSSCGY
jgi:hypothetical protein